MSTSKDVQYIGGYHDAFGGYHEYIGGNVMSTLGDVQYIGDIMIHVEDIMSTYQSLCHLRF